MAVECRPAQSSSAIYYIHDTVAAKMWANANTGIIGDDKNNRGFGFETTCDLSAALSGSSLAVSQANIRFKIKSTQNSPLLQSTWSNEGDPPVLRVFVAPFLGAGPGPAKSDFPFEETTASFQELFLQGDDFSQGSSTLNIYLGEDANAGISRDGLTTFFFMMNPHTGKRGKNNDVRVDPLSYNIVLTLCSGDSDGDGVDDGDDGCPDDPEKTDPGQCGCGVAETGDSDEDGVPDCVDNCPTDDGKTEPGVCGCGIPETDLDSDGTPDCNDGCPTDPLKTAAGDCGCGTPETDSDSDGTPDCNDGCPSDADKTAAGICGCGSADTDTDSDGTPDCNDNCSSDPLKTEPGTCGCGTPDTDTDSDGTPDCYDQCPGAPETDTDSDGTPDCSDDCPSDPTKTAAGECGCGTPDTDSDSDGTPDCNDACPSDADKTAAGACGCGSADTDSDSDGAPDCNDNCPSDPLKTEPGDCGCGVSESSEDDQDEDGVTDCLDGCPLDPLKTAPGTCGCGTADTDSDSDGTLDCNEECDDDPLKTAAGTCGCGVADTDSDSDGTPDCKEECDDDPLKTVAGDCGCGTPEADSDSDGTPDCNDACSSDPLKTAAGECGCGTPDTDSDSDGTPDCNDACPSDPAKTAAGICGCGTSDTDSDSDGIPDCNDNCPLDPLKTAPGDCGCGSADVDSDSDGILDCDDDCPDDPDTSCISSQEYMFSCTGGPAGEYDGILVEVSPTLAKSCNLDDSEEESVLLLGDDASDYAYRMMLSCTVSAPFVEETCNPVIGARLELTRDSDSSSGIDPLTTPTWLAGGVGIASSTTFLGSPILEPGDLFATPEATMTTTSVSFPDSSTVTIDLTEAMATGLNLDGENQFRLSMVTASNSNGQEDVVAFAGGQSASPPTFVLITRPLDTPECQDLCPGDENKKAPGACGCGVADTDSDGDGTADCNDDCPSDSDKAAAGQCGCGSPDTDSDGDGTADCVDSCPADPAKTSPGSCGCGVSDSADSDGDGTIDCDDGCPTDASKTSPGTCGCGVADTDSDSDGTPDCNDACPVDPDKTSPGECGCGKVEDVGDSDGDGSVNCKDPCPTDPLNACGVGGSLRTFTAPCPANGGTNDGLLQYQGTSSYKAWNTGVGAAAFRLGDLAAQALRYGFIMSCDTSGLDLDPDLDTVVSVTLNLHYGTLTRHNPLTDASWGPARAVIDVAEQFGSSRAVDANDYAASADVSDVLEELTFSDTDTHKGISVRLSSEGVAAVQRSGETQFRFTLDPPDNDDSVEQWVGFHSGQAVAGEGVRPTMTVTVFRITLCEEDQDGDDVCDPDDECDMDPNKSEPGICGCGVPDTDSDGDGAVDCEEDCDDDADKTAPGVCGCGVPDTDVDSDGLLDCNDGCPNDPDKSAPGTCGCGVSDTDVDGDGAVCDDGCPTDPNKTSPGTCGCGTADTDSDSDGTADCNDGCPDDPDKTEPGFCGCDEPEDSCVTPPSSILSSTGVCHQYGVHELVFDTGSTPSGNLYTGLTFTVTFTLPESGSVVTADGFYDGGSTFRARAYCGEAGVYSWTSSSSVGALNGKSGTFQSVTDAIPSGLHGKLRQHPEDEFQFQWDDGEWFIHLGDTGYRYVIPTEPEALGYMDDVATDMQATKVRTWFAEGRHTVATLFETGRTGMRLSTWQGIEARVKYALENYPWVQLQLIPYGEDDDEMILTMSSSMSAYVAKYAQARFSSFPNVQWCVINDRAVFNPTGLVAEAMSDREPWGTLLTTHQFRGTGYQFVNADWSDLVTLQTEDEFQGAAVRTWRAAAQSSGNIQAVILDEDRYEWHRTPDGDRPTWFRRFFWATIVSGGHPTYGGIKSWESYDGSCCRGVRPYRDMVNAGRLQDGFRDMKHIPTFFSTMGVTMVGLVPDNSRCGSDPSRWLCASDADVMVVYITPIVSPTSVSLSLPSSDTWTTTCWDPVDAAVTATSSVTGSSASVTCPGSRDAVLFLRREAPVSVDFSDPAQALVTGRVLASGSAIKFDFPGVSVKVKVSGTTSVTATLTDNDRSYYWVVVNGAPHHRFRASSGTNTYNLATGLSSGATHEVELVKSSEARVTGGASSSAIVTLHSMEAEPGATLHAITAPTRRIEFMGDSLVAGWGNLCDQSGYSQSDIKAASDNYVAWGSKMCRSLGASCHQIAWSGFGHIVNRDGATGSNTMPHVFKRTLGNDVSTEDWGFEASGWAPDAIMFNLGSNDFCCGHYPTDSEFADAIVEWMGEVAETFYPTNPPAFFLSCGPFQFEYCDAMALAQTRGQAAGHTVYNHRFDGVSTAGCVSHPDATSGTGTMASQMEAIVRSAMGW